MKKFYELIVVIPLRPDVSVELTEAVIEDFIRYTRVAYRIIIMDDSGTDAVVALSRKFPALDIHYASRPLGRRCGSYINLSMVYKRVLERYHFNALLKLETGGWYPEAFLADRALRLFDQDHAPGIGGFYSPDCRSDPGDADWKFIRKLMAGWRFSKLYRKALHLGYMDGESISWGSYCMSEPLLTKLNEAGLLPDYALRNLNMGEGHLFGLLARVAGFGVASLPGKRPVEMLNSNVHG